MKDAHFSAKNVFIHPALSPQFVNKSVIYIIFLTLFFILFLYFYIIRFMYYFYFIFLLLLD